MNSRLRMLLVGRRFWPHGSIDSAAFLYQLAIGLSGKGVHVEVLSPRYASSWPDEVVLREMTLHRPAAAPRSDWSMGRYVRHMTHWLRDQAPAFDVILVDSIRDEAIAAVEATKETDCKTIVRCAGWGPHSDAAWWQQSRSARRCIAAGRSADAAICFDPDSHRALLTEGFLSSRIHRVDVGYPAAPAASPSSRSAARVALASVNRDLHAEDEHLVVLAIGEMTSGSGLEKLAREIVPSMERFSELRLWLIGDGANRESIHQRLRSEGIRSVTAIPGSFSDVEDLLTAADVFVQADQQGLDHFLPAAISAELPVVVCDTPACRTVIEGKPNPHSSEPLVEWFSPESGKELRQAIRRVVEDFETHKANASQLRRQRMTSQSQDQTLDSIVKLAQRLTGGRRAGIDSSVEAAS